MTNDDFIVLADRSIGPVSDRLRRYCGLRWSGGDPETWAYRYYDKLVDTDPHRLLPVDVLSAAAMHSGLSRSDLGWFNEHTDEVDAWLAGTPDGDLADAGPGAVDQLVKLVGLAEGTQLSLLTKVLHRKRPQLVPIAERRLLDLYRPVTGERSAVAAWPALVTALAADLRNDSNRRILECATASLALTRPLSTLRAADICVWLGGEQ